MSDVSMKQSKNRRSVVNFLAKYNTVIIFVLLIIVSSIISPSFLTTRNIFNIMRQYTGLAVVSVGMLLVILTGGVDLSVGSVVALGSVLTGYFLQTMPMLPALLCTVAFCSLSGVGTGFFVAIRKVPPFVATLAFMTIIRGITFIVSKGNPIRIYDEGIMYLDKDLFLGIPTLMFLVVIVFVIFFLILKYTVFGRLITAIGSNESAVRLSGITVQLYKYLVYIITAILCSLAGIVAAARAGLGSPQVGSGMELDAIAAVVIGGASLSGGKGSVINTLLGVFILGIIGNVMNLMNIAAYPHQVIKGIVILIAVLLQGVETKHEK